jgi:hypothetical protein
LGQSPVLDINTTRSGFDSNVDSGSFVIPTNPARMTQRYSLQSISTPLTITPFGSSNGMTFVFGTSHVHRTYASRS